VRPVDPGPPVADHDVAPAGQRLGDQQQVAGPTALVLVVLPGWPARPGATGRGGVISASSWRLVSSRQTWGRRGSSGRVEPPSTSSMRQPNSASCSGGDAPGLPSATACAGLLQGLADRLVRHRLHHPQRTSRSASSRRVQRLWPSGGALQVSATRWASCSPSSRRRYWRAGGLR
jgi:hypothetical protein